jgi:hypothetical protein
MFPYMHEDAMFDRLETLQRELESSRVMAQGLPGWGRVLRNLGARAWVLGGLAMRRAPRRRPVASHHAAEDVSSSNAA